MEPFLYNFGVDVVFHGERPIKTPGPLENDIGTLLDLMCLGLACLSISTAKVPLEETDPVYNQKEMIYCRLAGHVHAYERNYQTFNYQQNGCAPRWITMGA